MISGRKLLRIDTATNWSETATTREDRLPSPQRGRGREVRGIPLY